MVINAGIILIKFVITIIIFLFIVGIIVQYKENKYDKEKDILVKPTYIINNDVEHYNKLDKNISDMIPNKYIYVDSKDGYYMFVYETIENTKTIINSEKDLVI